MILRRNTDHYFEIITDKLEHPPLLRKVTYLLQHYECNFFSIDMYVWFNLAACDIIRIN